MHLLETSQKVFFPLHLIKCARVGLQVGTGSIGSHRNGDFVAAANKMIRQLDLWGAAGEWNASISQTDLEM